MRLYRSACLGSRHTNCTASLCGRRQLAAMAHFLRLKPGSLRLSPVSDCCCRLSTRPCMLNLSHHCCHSHRFQMHCRPVLIRHLVLSLSLSPSGRLYRCRSQQHSLSCMLQRLTHSTLLLPWVRQVLLDRPVSVGVCLLV